MPLYCFRCDECGHEHAAEMSFAQHAEFTATDRGHFPGLGSDLPFSFAYGPDTVEWATSKAAGIACGQYRQVLRFSFARSMPEHFNHSLGTYVSNSGQAQSALSRQSDEMSARMGFDHTYELIDPSDAHAAGVTGEGLEATERRAVDDGRVETKAIFT